MRDTGVVDPIRVPDWLREPAERWWRETPPLARVFVGLVVIDVVGRALGLLAPRIDWAYLTPLSFVATFLPRDLWIVLPALLVIRRPDAATATPWILGGAITVAVVTIARDPLRAILEGSAGGTTMSLLIGTAANLGLLAAWVLLARGLAGLTTRQPSETVAGLANLGAAAVALLAALGFADVLVAPGIDVGDPALSQAMTLSSLGASIQLLGWAYLMWVVIRGFGDTRRSPVATALAGAGAILASLIELPIALAFRVFGAAGVDVNGGSGLVEVLTIVSWLAYGLGPTLIAIAFALGLAEPPLPYVPQASPEPVSPEPPQPSVAPASAEPPFAESPFAGTPAGEPTPDAVGESSDEEPAILPE